MMTQNHFHHSMLFPGTKNLGTTSSKISGSKSTFDSLSQEVYAKDLEGNSGSTNCSFSSNNGQAYGYE